MTAAQMPPDQTAVIVIGDAMLDRYWEGAVERISPEAPVPVLHVRRQFDRPGGAANVALNLAELGHETTLLSLLGDDEAGERLAALLAMHGVRLMPIRDPQMPTTQKVRPVCRRQQLLRMDFEGTPAPAAVQRLTDAAAALLCTFRWALLSDYGKGSLRDCARLIAEARAWGCRVLADPKGQDFARYRGAYVLKPNADEARAVVGPWDGEADFLARMHRLRESVGVEHLLVTRGELGMCLCSAGGGCFSVPAEVRDVYDVSGAGDTVLAALVHALSHGQEIQDAVRSANRAAGLVVGKFGTASVTAKELDAAPPKARTPWFDGSPVVRAASGAATGAPAR